MNAQSVLPQISSFSVTVNLIYNMDKYAAEFLFAEEVFNSIAKEFDSNWQDHGLYKIVGTRRYLTENIEGFLMYLNKRQNGTKIKILMDEAGYQLKDFLESVLLYHRESRFDHFDFLQSICFLASFCAFLYTHGLRNAPEFAISAIADVIIFYEESLKVFDHTWHELDKVAGKFLLSTTPEQLNKMQGFQMYPFLKKMFLEEV